ncbi:MAG: hypothetical protein ABIH08_06805, partial [Candidatus Omnitrophota bacterium]
MILKKDPFVFLSSLVIFILTFSLLFTSTARAMGLEVDPEQIKVEDCLTGVKLAVSELMPQGAKLQIHNKSAESFTYTITPLYCLEIN